MSELAIKCSEIQRVLYKDEKTCIELVRHQNQHLIRKKINISPENKNYALHELKFMMGISHPNVVKYLHHEFDNQQLDIYMPYYPLSDLHHYLMHNHPSFQERMRMFIDVLVGLQQLHSRFIIHRDIKLKNIFITEDLTCVVGDLGVATTSLDSATSQVGTFCYNAPEIYDEDECYNEKVDVWAVGIIAYQLFNAKRNGKLPFPFLDPQEMRSKINIYGHHIAYKTYIQLTNEIIPCDQHLPPQIKQMIYQMLQNRPEKRINWIQFYDSNKLGKFDLLDRLCTFKAEYRLLEDTKTNLKRSLENMNKFKNRYFLKLRHILSEQHRKYFINKYSFLKEELEAVYRVYLRLLRDSVDYYNELCSKRIYKYAAKLKPLYKAITRELYHAEVITTNCNRKRNRMSDCDSPEYFYVKLKLVTEFLDQIDADDLKGMEKLA